MKFVVTSRRNKNSVVVSSNNGDQISERAEKRALKHLTGYSDTWGSSYGKFINGVLSVSGRFTVSRYQHDLHKDIQKI